MLNDEYEKGDVNGAERLMFYERIYENDVFGRL